MIRIIRCITENCLGGRSYGEILTQGEWILTRDVLQGHSDLKRGCMSHIILKVKATSSSFSFAITLYFEIHDCAGIADIMHSFGRARSNWSMRRTNTQLQYRFWTTVSPMGSCCCLLTVCSLCRFYSACCRSWVDSELLETIAPNCVLSLEIC